jgi:hypothetical protein
MSVLIEAHSVIVRCDAVHQRHAGGWELFQAEVPNRTFCSDGEVARVGFMAPDDAKIYLSHLMSRGLRLIENGKAVDIAAAFQLSGLILPCDWLDFYRLSSAAFCGSVACCRLRDSAGTPLATPNHWKYEGSLSQTFGIFPDPRNNPGVKFLRYENGLEVYYDMLAEKEVYVARTEH